MQIRSLSLLLMIVSIAIAVLPVWRSPMISSRWPRRIGIIPSIAIRPVCTGSSTGWRWATPGALYSARRARDHAGSFDRGRTGLGRGDLAAVVERTAERVDHAAEQLRADRDLEQVAGPFDRVALDDLVPLAEQHAADVVGLEVQRQAGHPVGQLQHLQRHAVVKAVDAGDAVGHGEDGANLGQIGGIRLQTLDPLPQDAPDLVRLDLHRHASQSSLRRARDAFSQFVQTGADARVKDHVADPQHDPAEDLAVHSARQLDFFAGLPFDLLADLADHTGVELDRAGDGDVEALVGFFPELVVLAADAEDLRHPAFLDQQLEGVGALRLGAGHRALQALDLLVRAQVRAEQEDLQLTVAVDGVELPELLLQLVDLAFVLSRVEEGLGVYACGVGHLLQVPLVLRARKRGEVDLAERLLDEPFLVRLGERFAGDFLGCQDGEVGDLATDRVERTPRLRLDLA